MTNPDTSFEDVLAYITDRADETDLSLVFDAYKTRTRILRNRAAAAVRVGCQVTLGDLSPKYLNGLSGLVKSIDGQRCTVTLTPKSTRDLRYLGARRWRIPADVEQYDLSGIPLSSAKTGV